MSGAEFEKAKAFLQTNNAAGQNVYDHLSNVLLKILAEQPADAVGLFENISSIVKQDAMPAAPTEGATADQDPASRSRSAAQGAYVKACSAAYRGAEPTEEGEEAGGPPDVALERTQDLLDEANNFEWAGVYFGREETFRLYSAMRSNVEREGDDVGTVRLWGKVLGRAGDYYVFEADNKANDSDDKNDLSGTNQYVYWAASSSSGAWTRLPNVTPAQIQQARQNRRFLTGDLTAPVPGFPQFNGNEANYLRAQIACISSDTVLVAAGAFELDEDSGLLNAAEEPATGDSAADAGTWCQKNWGINAAGRSAELPAEEDDEGNETVAAIEAGRAALEGVDGADWAVRECNGAAVFRSLRWPGAHTVGRIGGDGARAINIYVGYGQPAASETYTPPMPPAIQGEFDDSEFKEAEDVTEDPTPPAPEEEEGEYEEEG